MRLRKRFASRGQTRLSRRWSVLLVLVVAFALAFATSTTAQASVPQDTATTVTANPPAVAAGTGNITFTIAVTPVTGTGPVTGSGTYTIFGPGHVPLASDTFNAPSATVNISGFSAGNYTVEATFTGNTTWAASSGQATGAFVQGMTVTVVNANPATTAGDGGIDFTVNVVAVGGLPGPVTGTGSYTLYGPGGAILATNTFTAPGTTVHTTGFDAGEYTLTATFTGTTTWAGSSGQATGTYTPNTATTTSLVAAPTQAAPGVPVTFTATVSGTGGPPSGTVTFKEGSTVLGTGTLTAGVASFTTSALSLGSHAVTASYGGGGAFAASTSSPVTVQITSTPPTTTATLSPTPNANGWFRGPATTTLKATPGASGSPVAATYFAIDTPACGPSALGSCSTYGAPFTVTGDGVHTVTYFSRDASGAVEAPHTVTVRIDGKRPALTITASPGGSGLSCFTHRGVVLHLTARDPAGSGVAGISYQIRGAGHRPPTSVSGATAAVTLSSNGVSIMSATATDRAGNVSTVVSRWVATLRTPWFSITCTGRG